MKIQLKNHNIVKNANDEFISVKTAQNITIMLLIKSFRIGPVTGPRLAVLDRGRRPRSNTADRGSVTGPIQNNLINEIFINQLSKVHINPYHPLAPQAYLRHS